ncbi:Transcription repressor OFP18 [Hirschfeldia incana]|nr:Transcription repressor OFP18 [Hirschfeldia incana]
MKLPFLNKITSYSSSSSSSWPSASCHQQNPKKIFFRDFFTVNKPKNVNKPEPPSRSFSSSTTTNTMEKPRDIESIENVIRGLKSSKRLTFERRGRSNSILEEVTKRDEEEDAPEEEEGFMLLSLESNDPYSDFMKSMEKMVDLHALHHDWRRLEKLLFLLLKVNVKTSHKYICAAFVDLILNLSVQSSKDVAQEPCPVLVEESPSSPLSFYTSYSSSDDTSSTSVRGLPENLIVEKRTDVFCCLSSLFEMEEKIKDNID